MTRQDLVNKSIDKLNTVKEALEPLAAGRSPTDDF